MTDLFFINALFVFFSGACIGSFLNVCIYRIPAGKSIVSPGSACPECKTPIPFYLNIPVLSYIFLLGRCRFCKTKISLRYPLIELLTAGLTLLLFMKFGPGLEFVYYLVFISFLIAISFIDFDHQIIPDVLSIPGIVIFASSFYILPGMTLKLTIMGILLGGGSLYLVAFLYYLIKKQEGMGGGDIKLLAMIGAATGVKGVVFTIFSGSLLGTVFGVLLIIFEKAKQAETAGAEKLRIPFGPFLSSGAVLYIFYGKELIQWYLGVF